MPSTELLLPDRKLHGTRHNPLTLALAEGIEIHNVSKELNHNSTREVYTHMHDAAECVVIYGAPEPERDLSEREFLAEPIRQMLRIHWYSDRKKALMESSNG